MSVAAFNRVIFIGSLGSDPRMEYTPGGKAVTRFSLAVCEGPKDVTLWVRVVVWEKTAEHCNQYLHKGDQMLVEGRLKHIEWTDDKGEKRSMLQVTAFYNGVRFLNGGHKSAESDEPGIESPVTDEIMDDDLPW